MQYVFCVICAVNDNFVSHAYKVGLGKTPQTLAILLDSHAQDAKSGIVRTGPDLVVVPLSLKQQWLDEIRKFTKLSAGTVWRILGSQTLRTRK